MPIWKNKEICGKFFKQDGLLEVVAGIHLDEVSQTQGPFQSNYNIGFGIGSTHLLSRLGQKELKARGP